MRNLGMVFFGILLLLQNVIPVTAFSANDMNKIRNKHYKFSIRIPGQMKEVIDSCSTGTDQLFYDSSARIILMISARESKFKSVDDYLTCTSDQLQQRLRDSYGDSTLTLISCNRSPYYAQKVTVLHFQVSVSSGGYNTYFLYLIHHRGKDIQISFTYSTATEQQSAGYISAIMQTLKLTTFP